MGGRSEADAADADADARDDARDVAPAKVSPSEVLARGLASALPGVVLVRVAADGALWRLRSLPCREVGGAIVREADRPSPLALALAPLVAASPLVVLFAEADAEDMERRAETPAAVQVLISETPVVPANCRCCCCCCCMRAEAGTAAGRPPTAPTGTFA